MSSMKISRGKVKVSRSAAASRNANGELPIKSAVVILADTENPKDEMDTKKASEPVLPKEIGTNNEGIEEKRTCKGDTSAEAIKSNSTPRRKKDPLANLYSSLSPKYIGFSTPKSAVTSDAVTPSSDEKPRFITRRKRLNNESAESFSKNTCSSDLIIASPDTISYVRRTNSSNVLSSPSSNCGASELGVPSHQRLFESPIEKLLRKNRSSDLGTTSASPISVFEPQIGRPRKPIERKELMDIKVKVARVESIEKLQKHGISTFQLDQHDNVINVPKFSSNEESIPQTLDENLNNVVEPKRKLSKKTKQEKAACEENKQVTNPVELTAIEKDLEDERANDRVIPKDKPEDSVRSNAEDCQEINVSAVESDAVVKVIETINSNKDCMELTSQAETTINISDNSVETVNNEFEATDETQTDSDNNSKMLPIKDLENDFNELKFDKHNVDDNKTKNDTETVVEVTPTSETDVINDNAITDIEDNTQNMTAKDGISNSVNIPESDLHFEKPQEMENISLSPEGTQSIEHNNADRNDEDKSDKQCEPSVIKIDIVEENSTVVQLETIDCTQDFDVVNTNDVIVTNSMPVENNISVKSPSSISLDSAKGSSVNNDILWMSFSPGDLFWGQIYSYCYWPCMVCPDPEGKTITSESSGRNNDVHVMVHVRFFADNARRNWVKRENLLAFVSLENYQVKMMEAGEKYGKKHPRYKAFVVSKAKTKVWHKAVEEANIVIKTPQNDRLEKFYEIYENTKAIYQLSRKRRQSMFGKSGSTSDIGSLYDSTDNLSTKHTFNGPKRDRSISPFSPAYSPVSTKSVKRRKLSENEASQGAMSSNSLTPYQNINANGTEESESSFSTSSQQQEEIFNNVEFKKFMKEMKDFVMEQNHDEKLEKSLVVAVRNIWALRHINKCQMKAKLLESFNEQDLGSSVVSNEDSIKRLSNRIRNISFRQSLTPQYALNYGLTYDKEKTFNKSKSINRPIEEVIDDIFNLDKKYLFKGLARDPICKYCFKPGGRLLKCSKTCQSWLHVECNGKSYDEINKKRPRPKSKTATNSDLVKPTTTLDKSYSLHITADDIQQPNAGSSAAVQSMNESFSENAVSSPKSTDSGVVCHDCKTGAKPKCAVCDSYENELKEELITCNVPHCLNTFHPACCRYWPQAKITKSNNKIESFRCPSHVCHTCVSDDPKGKFQNISSSKITKCVKCPATFHTDSTCIPAGSQILTAAYIICPRHAIAKSDQKINVNWCFICVTGGQVVCCDTCPTAVHAACLNIPIDSDEGYICEECETGRMPLYGEMVWAKFNSFRWWPAIILPPTEIPNNISRIAHNPSDFVVRFFGTHDHGWISRRRVYLYLEGDSTEPPKTYKSIDYTYQKGVEEAKKIWEIVKTKKHGQRLTVENKQKLHPHPYVKIKANRVVPPLKLHIDLEKVNKCDCKKTDKNPCGPDSNCLNRVLYHECNPKLCPAGQRCQNQMFESRISPKLEVVYMKERGFGLICREPISAGTFVIEYVGEVINDAEFRQRLHQKSIDRDENFYFLSLEKDYIIDAGPKGNLARFMNHSCDPNCETQKWSVNGLDRVGLFAISDIPENTELTFNYHWDDLLGNEKKTCFCGAIKCAGQIGGKFKEAKIMENANSKKSKNSKDTAKTLKNKSLKRLQIKKHKAKQAHEKTILKIKSKTKSMKLKTSKTETSSSDQPTHDKTADEMPSTSNKDKQT